MNREIKFRAKAVYDTYDAKKGDWVYGDLHLRSKYPHIHQHGTDKVLIDTATIGQFTGLHDKNGKEIYEGDLIATMISGDELYEVFWNDRMANFVLKGKNNILDLYASDTDYYTVIGNIYDTKTEEKK